ncbi:unnamed protein product [Mesocestoides corti]|uniref:Neuropeptide F n=1 Tax=Mesocestoides corti TaxID=53468 RepID=A0A0R3UNM7_MESCO|nr:unnamed protein product [Mesocestoides corti]
MRGVCVPLRFTLLFAVLGAVSAAPWGLREQEFERRHDSKLDSLLLARLLDGLQLEDYDLSLPLAEYAENRGRYKRNYARPAIRMG